MDSEISCNGKKWTAVFWILACWLVASSAYAIQKTGGDHPITITSQRLEMDDRSKTVIFKGNVKAVQGDVVIRCSEMKVFYKKSGANLEPGTERITQIVASGNVKVRQGNRLVGGDTAQYDHKKQKIEITGNPYLEEGMQRVKGEKITFFLDRKRFVVEGNSLKPVEAVLFPSEIR